MTEPFRRVPDLPRSDERRKSSSSDEDSFVEDVPPRKPENNQVEPRSGESDNDDEVFHPSSPPSNDQIAVIKEDVPSQPPVPQLRNRRVSYGKIPIPPMPVTVHDIQEAAKQSREEGGEAVAEVRVPADPRRSSVSVDVFKGFRDPHDKKNLPAKDKTIYVEGPGGKFREMKKGRFWRQEMIIAPESEEVEDEDEESVIPFLLKTAGQAFRTQRVYNQIANIVQGFLAGISVMLAIFSFNLDPEVLLSGYRYMSLPIHAAFLVAFTVGFVSAIDRTGIYEVEHFSSKERLKATIYNNGLFTVVVWFIGLIATLLCIQLESQLAFAPEEVPDEGLVANWRIFNVFRALAAAVGFLLLAFKPDSDTLAKELKQAIFDQLDETTTDPERKEVILAAMKISRS